MADRKASPETNETTTSNDKLQQAIERAERAEAELARLKAGAGREPALEVEAAASGIDREAIDGDGEEDGEAALRKDSMMAHLMDSLDAGKDIGHYGRLVFAMVARHFLPGEEVVGWLTRDPDFSEEQAVLMLRQVEGRDYNPPKRERILAWQAEQEFPILPNPEDPDCGNLYRNLKFPDSIYHHIEEYQEHKIHSESV
ncbi:hypothetical protein ACPOL_1731 [Acidisarcina polymorpha]|uniref:Uncharacterized protein n=1 Tax=Acidisarcina polymorpha TaxID=2211140 RepID=A0A2Z5FW05_9BACT|nr:hypothetical protein [Acidisarcina polymorpha]AXC11073.1 hypothetical protein ACPOL_1731 [Acidisarcina polymorpha]